MSFGGDQTSVKSEARGPELLDDFKPTRSGEGEAIPIVFGRCRIPGNILWYGNLTSEPVYTAAASGGKNGSSSRSKENPTSSITGYLYKLDLWYGLCLGTNVALRAVYVDDDPVNLVDFGEYEYNSGNLGTYPTEPGAYASPLTGMAHIFLPQHEIGANIRVPQIHFEVEVTSDAPLTTPNFASGMSPAAVIYEYLIMGGATASDIDTVSFDEASEYWDSVFYGLNIYVNEIKSVRASINDVFKYVDGVLDVNKDNKFTLKAFRATDSSVCTVVQKDISNFDYQRQSWEDLATNYSANFIDEDQEFTKRAISIQNQAVRDIIGYIKQVTVDLSAMRDVGIASNRLTEIMKKNSYPGTEHSFNTSLKYNNLIALGDVITIDNDDYGSSQQHRVTKINYSSNDKNQITFTVQQFIESLIDSEPVTAGNPSWSSTRHDPEAVAYQKIWEIPGVPQILQVADIMAPAFLILAARVGQEVGFQLIGRDADATDWWSQSRFFSTWSQYGLLTEDYSADTLTIDDSTGILYEPYNEDPVFPTISRSELFTVKRCALVGDELIGFQTVTYEGTAGIRLTGCVRGVNNTPVSAHSIDDPIWLFYWDDNILTDYSAKDFYVKLLPYFSGISLDAADAVEYLVEINNKGIKKPAPSKVSVTRSGSTCTVTIWRTVAAYQEYPTPSVAGYWASNDPLRADADPADYSEGRTSDNEIYFYWHENINFAVITKEQDASTFSYTLAGLHNLYVHDRYSSNLWAGTRVEATDGTYVGQTNVSPYAAYSETALQKLRHGTWGYTHIMEHNNALLNDTLLQVSGMLDVDLTSLANDDILKWNESSGKWKNVRYYAHFSTTTTTTSSSSSTTAPV